MLGWVNTLNYKNFSFSFQFDGRIGGDIYSYTNYMLQVSGRAEVTAPNGSRDQFVLDGVIPDGKGGYTVNNVAVTPQQYWSQGIGTGNQGIAEANIYDGTNFRLRKLPTRNAEENLFPAGKIGGICKQRMDDLQRYGRYRS